MELFNETGRLYSNYSNYVTKNRGLKNISLYMSVTSQHIIEKRTTH